MMDCRTVMKLNDRYLAEGLSDDVLSEYISHIETCESCRDNLMTDYSITKAIEQINQGADAEACPFAAVSPAEEEKRTL